MDRLDLAEMSSAMALMMSDCGVGASPAGELGAEQNDDAAIERIMVGRHQGVGAAPQAILVSTAKQCVDRPMTLVARVRHTFFIRKMQVTTPPPIVTPLSRLRTPLP